MSAIQVLTIAFWLLPLLLQPTIAVAIIIRKLAPEFRWFLSYTVFVAGRDFALLLFRTNTNSYAWIYWLGEPVTIALGLAAIYEILWYLIKPYSTLRLLGIRLFWGSLAFAVIVGILLLRASPFAHMKPSVESARLLERSAWFIEAGVLIAFVFFISRLGLTWKHYTAGIVAGFGASAGLQLAFVELESLHLISGNIFALLKSAAYNCAVFIWAGYFLLPRKPIPPQTELPKSDLPRWDEVLRRYLEK